MSENVNDLFNTAHEEGDLSNEAMQALEVVDVGAQIQAGLGESADEFMNGEEVVLVTIMPDDSGSIRFAGNAQVVRDGHNLVLDSLMSCNQHANIRMHTRYLNGFVLYPYSPLDQVIRMDKSNYNPNQGTPLYDQSVLLLGTVIAKNQEFIDTGIRARTVSLILSDGADQHSERANPKMVKSIVDDMYRTENHIISAMGIYDGDEECDDCGEDLKKATIVYPDSGDKIVCPACGQRIHCTNFREVFLDMGIRSEWILTPGNNESDIRKAFQVFSQSAVRASQGAQSFSKAAMGGFGSN